jgi:hypothetical protein
MYGHIRIPRCYVYMEEPGAPRKLIKRRRLRTAGKMSGSCERSVTYYKPKSIPRELSVSCARFSPPSSFICVSDCRQSPLGTTLSAISDRCFRLINKAVERTYEGPDSAYIQPIDPGTALYSVYLEQGAQWMGMYLLCNHRVNLPHT